jgi:peptidyl-prolyl cis-trans isomerase C
MRMSPRHPALRAFGLACLAAVLAGCGKKDVPVVPAAPAPPPPLARVNDRAITEADFQAEVARRLEGNRPMSDAATVLREMVEREVMLQEARRSEWIRDAGVQRELENQILVKWLDRTLQIEKDGVTVSDEDLRKIYQERIAEFTKPPLVRLAILYREATPLSSTGTVAALRAELEKGRALYLADPAAARHGGRMSGFGSVAADHSEEAISRYRGGDLGWVDPTRADDRLPREVLDAGLALDIGKPSEVLVTDKGLYVVMKSDARPAQVTPFEEVVAGLRRRALRERQEQVQRDFMARLLAAQRIEIQADQAARLQIPASSGPAQDRLPPALRAVPGLPSSLSDSPPGLNLPTP